MRKRTTTGLSVICPRRFRRGVACLLLLLVTYSVAAELFHKHGQMLAARAETVSSFDSKQEADATVKLSWSDDVCLLCQFQQQLAHGLMQVPPFALRPLTRTALIVLTDSYELPTVRALPCGRAPPLASVL